MQDFGHIQEESFSHIFILLSFPPPPPPPPSLSPPQRALTSMSDDVEQILLTVDAHSVADTLKQYLRGLPEPLLKAALFDDWAAAVKM